MVDFRWIRIILKYIRKLLFWKPIWCFVVIYGNSIRNMIVYNEAHWLSCLIIMIYYKHVWFLLPVWIDSLSIIYGFLKYLTMSRDFEFVVLTIIFMRGNQKQFKFIVAGIQVVPNSMGFQQKILSSSVFSQLNWHIKLANKISALGTRNKLLPFFESYLTNHKQFVSWHGRTTREFVATYGIPQGSHLGPPFCNIILNDLVHINK